MKKVDIVYPYWISSLTGPSKNLLRFKENESFFEGNNIKLNFFSMDCIIQKKFTINERKKATLKSKIVEILIILSKYNAFFSWQLIKRSFRSSKIILAKYLNACSQPDIIEFQDLFTCYFYLKRFPNPKVKIILFNHTNGEDFKMYQLYYPKLRNSKYYSKLIVIQDYVLNKIDKYVFISNLAREKFLELHKNFDRSKTYFFHNGVPQLFGDDQIKMKKMVYNRDYSKFNIICTGTVNRRKGQELILEALSQIELSKKDKINITFLGGGEEFENFKNLSYKLNLSKYVFFAGGVEDVDTYLAKANIFILASKDEGLPLSIIEAMRAYLPIIASNVAGIPEMVEHNINGILIEPNVDSIKNILNNLDIYNWKEMGLKAHETFESKFTLNKMMVNYCGLINKL